MRSPNHAAIVTVILTVGIWSICPAAMKPHSPAAIGLGTFLIAYPIYRLLYKKP